MQLGVRLYNNHVALTCRFYILNSNKAKKNQQHFYQSVTETLSVMLIETLSTIFHCWWMEHGKWKLYLDFIWHRYIFTRKLMVSNEGKSFSAQREILVKKCETSTSWPRSWVCAHIHSGQPSRNTKLPQKANLHCGLIPDSPQQRQPGFNVWTNRSPTHTDVRVLHKLHLNWSVS